MPPRKLAGAKTYSMSGRTASALLRANTCAMEALSPSTLGLPRSQRQPWAMTPGNFTSSLMVRT